MRTSLLLWDGKASQKEDSPLSFASKEAAACVQWVVEVSRTLGWLRSLALQEVGALGHIKAWGELVCGEWAGVSGLLW